MRTRYRFGVKPAAVKQLYARNNAAHKAMTLKTNNQLDALRSMSTVVADTGDIEEVRTWTPQDCTTNPSLILKVAGTPDYRQRLQNAIIEERESANPLEGQGLVSGVADRLIVNIGCDFLKIVPGRVSTEVDARLSYDTEATIDKARRLIGLYAEQGIDASRVYVKIASTWEGIRACEQLEREGINCNMTLMFSFAQAVACMQARATLVSPFVGRILDYYKDKEGREYEAHEDPGVISVKRVYNYFKRYGAETAVMAASFRNTGEIRELAGIDKITISPKLLKELADCQDPLERRLEPAGAARACEDEELGKLTEQQFLDMHNGDEMAKEKLHDGIKKFADDQEELEQLLTQHAEEEGLKLS